MSEYASGFPVTAAPPYNFIRQRLTASGAEPLIMEVLNRETTPLSNGEICDRIAPLHRSKGGISSSDISGVVKKALARLRHRGEVEMVGHHRYRACQPKDFATLSSQLGETEADNDEDDFNAAVIPDVRLRPEIEIGTGSEAVYVYFPAADRKLAGKEDRKHWPCKVGFTKNTVEGRILAQGATAMYSLPVVGLEIHTDSGRMIEKLIITMLSLVDRRLVSDLGAEWFNTNPEEVRDLYLGINLLLLPLVGETSSTMENAERVT